MTTPSLPLTDAELAAQWSIQATREGRYELAEAVLRIAAAAHRAETARPAVVPVPVLGTTRDERPRLRVATYGPAGDGDADLAPNGATQIMQAPPAHLDRRCTFNVVKGDHYQECHGAVYWVHGTVGDASTPAMVAHWEHVDDELNKDHHAFVEG